ncbi:MAG: TIGR02757 family protein [Bdellovibrionota bacterium]
MKRQQANQDKNKFLTQLLEQFHQPHWIVSDPVQYVHRYSRVEDQEIAGYLASCFAYGSVKLVHRAVARILSAMGDSPAKFVRNYKGQKAWPGFYHRFHTEEHVEILVQVLKEALDEQGSLGGLFLSQRDKDFSQDPFEQVLHGAALWFRERSMRQIEKRAKPELARGMRFFFNSPADGSACKRTVMFMRWMVRRDEIDIGVWDWMRPEQLVIPVDTHVARISYYLYLRGGKELQAPNWKMAREITQELKKVNPLDPVCYDFALARLGILDICKRKYVQSICERCPVEKGCRYSKMRQDRQ